MNSQYFILTIPLILMSISGDGVGYFVKILSIFVPLMYIFFFGGGFVVNKLYLVCLLYLVVPLFAIMPSKVNSFDFGYALTDSMFPVLIILATHVAIKKKDLEEYYQTLQSSIALSFFVFAAYFFIIVVFGSVAVFVEEQGASRLNGTFGPPATSIYLLGLSIPILANAIFEKSKNYFYLYVLVEVLIILTNTRIVVFASVLIFLYLFLKSEFEPRIKHIVAFVLVIPAVVIVIASAVDRLFLDNEVVSIDSINLNGREILWEIALDYLPNNWIFGHGAGGATSLLNQIDLADGLNRQLHNDYLKIVFNSGFFGLFLFFLVIYFVYKSSVDFFNSESNIKSKLIVNSYLIAFLVVMLTDNIYVYHFFIYPMFLYLTPIFLRK